jgi:hypothetical protein
MEGMVSWMAVGSWCRTAMAFANHKRDLPVLSLVAKGRKADAYRIHAIVPIVSLFLGSL